jgi:hypothetical protein
MVNQHHPVHVLGALFRGGTVMKRPGFDPLLQRRRDNPEPLLLDPDLALAHRTRTIVGLDRCLLLWSGSARRDRFDFRNPVP